MGIAPSGRRALLAPITLETRSRSSIARDVGPVLWLIM